MLTQEHESSVRIREASQEDAEAIAALLTQLGYPSDAAFVVEKLAELSGSPTFTVWVAEVDPKILGVIAFDSQPLFHQPGRVGCIMALCVSETARGKGVGKALVEHIEEIARREGCVKISVSSGLQRMDAHRFYRGLGYEENSKRFVKVV